MADIQSPTAEIRRGKKKKEEEERNRMKIYMVCPITQGNHNYFFKTAVFAEQFLATTRVEK